MTSKYIAASHSFQEQSQLPPPQGNWLQYHRDYNRHIQSLRNMPCRPGDKWQEGVLYTEGVDYMIYEGENGIEIREPDIYDAVAAYRRDHPEPPPVENGQWCTESQVSSAQLYQLFKNHPGK